MLCGWLWREIITYIDDPVVRAQAEEMVLHRSGTPPYGLNGDLGLRYQDVGGRIPHQSGQREKVDEIFKPRMAKLGLNRTPRAEPFIDLNLIYFF